MSNINKENFPRMNMIESTATNGFNTSFNNIINSRNYQSHGYLAIDIIPSDFDQETKKYTLYNNQIQATDDIVIGPIETSLVHYTDCGIMGESQGDGTLTFKCEDCPTETVHVQILLLHY